VVVLAETKMGQQPHHRLVVVDPTTTTTTTPPTAAAAASAATANKNNVVDESRIIQHTARNFGPVIGFSIIIILVLVMDFQGNGHQE
jgi:hypothetical protein